MRWYRCSVLTGEHARTWRQNWAWRKDLRQRKYLCVLGRLWSQRGSSSRTSSTLPEIEAASEGQISTHSLSKVLQQLNQGNWTINRTLLSSPPCLKKKYKNVFLLTQSWLKSMDHKNKQRKKHFEFRLPKELRRLAFSVLTDTCRPSSADLLPSCLRPSGHIWLGYWTYSCCKHLKLIFKFVFSSFTLDLSGLDWPHGLYPAMLY